TPKPRRTTRSASTWRRLPSCAAPDPGTSWTRIVADVTLRALTTSASAPRRSSAIGAMPTFVLPYSPPPDFVSAVKSAVFPLPAGPTMPTSSATAVEPSGALVRVGVPLAPLELLLQRDERAVLERLDRSFGLAEDRPRLGVCEVEDELQREHLLLLRGEILDELEHRLAPDRLERAGLGRRHLVGLRLRHLLLRLPALVRAEVVHGEVVRDAEGPRRERRRLPAEATDRLEHLQEGLRRQVLGVVAIADADVQVAVDAVEVDEVELLQGGPVPLLGAVDEHAHPL